uniref:ATP-dependent RNA helicase CshA (EC) n=1 Tax=Ganoderma boninense TaxID=34458 RepID=A0A5K1JZ99_9APHY|nr:ATP-dependent RNA helicase CshA (EC [Ganoderma boninense]
MDDNIRLSRACQALSYLQAQDIPISDLLSAVLIHNKFNRPEDIFLPDLSRSVPIILSSLYHHPITASSTCSWAHELMCSRYTSAAQNLSRVKNGWHFGAASATPEQVRDFRLEDMARSMRAMEPELWAVIFRMLGGSPDLVAEDAAWHKSSRDQDKEDAEYWIDDDDFEMLQDVHTKNLKLDAKKGRKHKERAALIRIKSVVVISIFMHAVDQQCNGLQSVMGIFLHSCSAPEKLIKVLARMGVSISLTSIHRAIESLSKQSLSDIETLGRTLLSSHAFDNFDAQINTLISTVDKPNEGLLHLTSGTLLRLQQARLEDLRCSKLIWSRSERNLDATDPRPFDPRATLRMLYTLHPEPNTLMSPLGLSRRGRFRAWSFVRTLLKHGPQLLHPLLTYLRDPEPVDKIPISRLYQTPLRAMDINQSTVSGNIEAILNIFDQAGLGNPHENPQGTRVDPQEYVVLVHGDLGTCERVTSAVRRRVVERTPYDRLQSVVFIPGLFHLKMAAADAIWRLLVSPDGARSDDTSFMKLAGELRPNESSKLVSNAKFRQQHELIDHIGTILQLDAWRVEVKRQFGYTSLEEWAATKPRLADIESVGEVLAKNYVEGEGINLFASRRHADDSRDRIRENTMRTLNYLFLYEELSYAMNAGDIGRIETVLPAWIQAFRAAGKHKYSHQMLRFWHALYFIYPEELRRVIRMNILVNPSGKAMEFRAVDWVVELLNLYIKACFSSLSL